MERDLECGRGRARLLRFDERVTGVPAATSDEWKAAESSELWYPAFDDVPIERRHAIARLAFELWVDEKITTANDLLELTGDALEAREEIPARPVRDEPPWPERDLRDRLQRVSRSGSPGHSGRRFPVMARQRFFRRAWGPAHACTSRWYALESSSKTAESHSAQSA